MADPGYVHCVPRPRRPLVAARSARSLAWKPDPARSGRPPGHFPIRAASASLSRSLAAQIGPRLTLLPSWQPRRAQGGCETASSRNVHRTSSRARHPGRRSRRRHLLEHVATRPARRTARADPSWCRAGCRMAANPRAEDRRGGARRRTRSTGVTPFGAVPMGHPTSARGSARADSPAAQSTGDSRRRRRPSSARSP